MLFAAGFGRRMQPLTQDRPKPLVEVAGKALIDHALDLVPGADIGRIVANIHYKSEMIVRHLAARPVTLSYESPAILETGGGLRAALPLLGVDPVLTLNSDAVWRGENPLRLLQSRWNPKKMDALLVCIPPQQARGHSGAGDFNCAPDGRLTRGCGLIYGGAQLLKTDGLQAISETAFSLNLLWDQMASKGRLYGVSYSGYWCDVGRPESIALAQDMLGSPDV